MVDEGSSGSGVWVRQRASNNSSSGKVFVFPQAFSMLLPLPLLMLRPLGRFVCFSSLATIDPLAQSRCCCSAAIHSLSACCSRVWDTLVS